MYIGENINILGYIDIVIDDEGYCKLGNGSFIGEADVFVAHAKLIIGKRLPFGLMELH